ncbi:MAG: hypothetical protein PUD12_00155 [Firmicutes bacterium]|nr:hypothetical protein [Bacillota bacterium]
MLSILVTILICWLSYKTLGILLSLTWGIVKIIGTVLLILAAPALVLCLLFAGGMLILLPLGLVAGAFLLGKACQ